MIRLLIAGDQPLVRTGIRTVVEKRPDLEVVGEARDGQSAIEQNRSTHPDVVLMNVGPDDPDGIRAIRDLAGPRRADGCAARVLMLTGLGNNGHLYNALHAGVSGIVVTNCDPDELINAIHTVARGEAVLSPSITKRLITGFIEARPDPSDTPSGALEALTSREKEVLRLLATGRSNAEIAARLFISEQTAKTHVHRVLTKLELRDRAHAVVFGYESGLVVPTGPAR